MPASIRSADPVADRPRMDAETLLAAERVGHRLGNRAEAKLDRRVVGDQGGDGVGDGAVDPPPPATPAVPSAARRPAPAHRLIPARSPCRRGSTAIPD